MRIAVLMQLAPRKLGSFERWVLALAEEARRRGHALDLYGLEPMHPGFVQRAAALGAGLFRLSDLPPRSPRTVRRLASYDVLHLNLLAPRSALALAAYAAWPAQVVFVDHTSGEGVRRAWPSRLVDRLTLSRVAQVVAVSDFVRERDRRRFALEGSRLRTVHNGVTVADAFPRPAATPVEAAPESSRPPRPLRVLAVAYLIPEKGVHHLLGAVARLPAGKVQVEIAGDGPEEAGLRAQARALGIAEHVSFLGLRDDVPARMSAADVFVHPARWGEAFGLTVAEAMAAGCAVVASRIGAMPELIEDGRTGLLVEPGDESQLAAVLQRLAQTPDEVRRLGRAAWEEARARFTLDQCVAEHLSACEDAGSTTSEPGHYGRVRQLVASLALTRPD